MLRRLLPWGAAALGLAALTAALLPDSAPGYVARQGWFQAELLLSRRPVDEVARTAELTEAQRTRLAEVALVKAYGARIGLSATHNYETVALGWDRTIYNVSACEPLAFAPRRWWFPIVGTVPYLGYFRPSDADDRARTLAADGLDVYVRTAGAYSTLGWFRDPILPGMLDWSEYALAETILHELAHATLWIPGSVQFNESFANFVGRVSARRYYAEVHGADSPEVRANEDRLADGERFTALQRELYAELDALYRDPTLSVGEKLNRKQAAFASLPARVAEAGFRRPDLWIRAARRGPWNNARLVQFRTYNRSTEWFEALLATRDGDLLAFIDDIRRITAGASDPYRALAEAVGAEPDPE